MRKYNLVRLATAILAVAVLICSNINLAYGATATLTIVGKKGVYKFSYPEIVEELGSYRLIKMQEVLLEICQKESIAPKDAAIMFKPNTDNRFSIKKESYGITADFEKLTSDVQACLSVGGGTVSISYNKAAPKLYEKDISLDIYKRGSFSTSYINSTAERSQNISIATSIINGTVIKNGETFSFNEVVGKRSEAKGYKNAKVIVDGKFENGIGGGICQVSTTLYNAALLSGLDIVTVSPHSLAVSYVDCSFDAMVSYGGSDLRFKNNTGSDIYIEGYTKSREVCFTIYGKKLNCIYRRESIITEKIPYTKKSVYNPVFDQNEYVIIQQGKPGIKSQGYLIKIENGITTRSLIRKDNYKMTQEIIECGRRECVLG